jgi:hypothetical protein
MKKIFIAIGMMAVCGIVSAAEAPGAASPPEDSEISTGCVISPCSGIIECKPAYRDVNEALRRLDQLEAPCQGPPKPNRDPQTPPPPSGGRG